MKTPALGREPSRIPQANLASAFGPPDRAASLAGVLEPRPVARLVEVPRVEAVGPSPTQVAEFDEDLRSHEVAEIAPGDVTKPLVVIVYLPVSLRDRLRQRAAERETTYTTTVLEAIDATHDRLDSLLATQRTGPRPGSLFSGVGSGRVRPRNAEPHVQVSLRLARVDLEVVDRLVAEHQAPNRSAMVATVLVAHLET